MARASFIVLMCLTSVLYAHGDCESTSDNWGQWLNCRIQQRLAAATPGVSQTAALDGTVRSPSKTSTDPAIQTNSNSLVDQTSAPDLLGFASHIAKLDSKVAGGQLDSYSFHTTGYALYAALNGANPLDPSFYAQGANWRRVAVDFGREVPDDKSSTPVGPANYFGAKVLLINHRDLARSDNITLINSLIPSIYDAAAASGRLSIKLQGLLGLTDNDLNRNGDDFRSVVTAAISNRNDSVNDMIDKDLQAILTRRTALRKVYDTISKKSQWSINFQGKKREAATFPDEYRVETALDIGLHPRFNLTGNAGWNTERLKGTAADQEGGRFAVQGNYRLTQDLSSPKPIILSFAGQGTWLTHVSPTYEVQFKTSLPILDGVDLPISVSFASKNIVLNEEHILTNSHFKSQFGFTFDVSKLMSKMQ